MLSGIYKINSKVLGVCCYVGESIHVQNRFYTHKRNLIRGKHHSKDLINHVKKYGVDDLVFIFIERVKIKSLRKKEHFYIKKLNPLYNKQRTYVEHIPYVVPQSKMTPLMIRTLELIDRDMKYTFDEMTKKALLIWKQTNN